MLLILTSSPKAIIEVVLLLKIIFQHARTYNLGSAAHIMAVEPKLGRLEPTVWTTQWQ